MNNTGVAAATDPALHPQDETAHLNNDIYRLSATASGSGWHAQLPNDLATAPFGDATTARVYVTRDIDAVDPGSVVTLTATSVSDGTRSDVGTCFAGDPFVALSQNFDPTQLGGPVTFTATVVADPADPTPVGDVQFSVDGAPVGSPVTLDAAGQAVLTVSDLALGTHSISAQYLGGGALPPFSGPPIDHTVKKRLATSTSVTSDLNPSAFGDPVAYTATVLPENASSGLPITGLVQFKVDGVAVGAPVALDASGMASVATDATPGGHHGIRGFYLGDANYTGSTSPTYVQTVRRVAPTGSVVSDPASPIAAGMRPTFTATFSNPVAPLGSLAPGEVQFLIDGTNFGAPATIASDGAAVFTVTWNLPAGSHVIRAHYLGNADFAPGNTAGYTLVINP